MTDYRKVMQARAKARRERIARLLNAGVTRKELCELYGISRQRLSKLIQQAEREGLLDD